MSFRSSLTNLTAGIGLKSVAGIEATFISGEEPILNIVLITKKGDIFLIENIYESKTHDELKKIIESGTPIVLTLSGSGILYRKIEQVQGENSVAEFNMLFPSANIKDFYIQRTANTENNAVFISVIRKDQCDQFVSKLNGLKIVKVLLGPFAINRLFPLIQNSGVTSDRLLVHRYDLSITNGVISDVSWSQQEIPDHSITLGEEKMNASQLVTYASAISYFLPDATVEEVPIESIAEARKDFSYEKKFKNAGVIIVATFFFILLINFFVFNDYYSKTQNLQQQLSVNSEVVAEMDSLMSRLNSKKQVLENYSAGGISKTSFYADVIAGSVPVSVTLSELYLFPIKKNNDGGDELEFDASSIVVRGSCKESIELNEWLKKLQQEKWVKKINVLSFNQEGEKERGEFSFQIDLI